MEDIRELIHEAPSLFLDEIAEWLAIYHEQPISTTVLHDNLRKLGLTYKKLRKVAAERDDAVQHGCTKSAPTIRPIKWYFSTNRLKITAPSIVTMAVRSEERYQKRGSSMAEAFGIASFQLLPLMAILLSVW
jgi:hypothetical protein